VLSQIQRARRGADPGPSWAIDAKPSALETKLWDKRDVDIYRLTIEEFLDGIGAP